MEQGTTRHEKLDRAAFERQVGPLPRELRLHCYRMSGSSHEADDLVQDTYLRAWRSLDSFEGRGFIRSWLYQIATNVCLNALAHRKEQRRQSTRLTQEIPATDPSTERDWPASSLNSLLLAIADYAPGPAARYEARESAQLAFVALIQNSPPRQRDLRDVLGWSAEEVGALLGGSPAAINSALQRARETLSTPYPEGRPPEALVLNHGQRELIDRYLRAWESTDLEGAQ